MVRDSQAIELLTCLERWGEPPLPTPLNMELIICMQKKYIVCSTQLSGKNLGEYVFRSDIELFIMLFTQYFVYTCCYCIVPGSTMSLVAGASFGGLLAYGAMQMSQNPKNFMLSFGGLSYIHVLHVLPLLFALWN